MANEWNKTAFVEFETMLRRHLRSGAAPVAACAGFDLDAASSYLEGALGGTHLASYESHLAGCAICRRHLIELARLAHTAPSFEAQPSAKPVRIPTWDRLKGSVTGWFDLSTWNLKWQIAGATGAAFAILIAALGAHSLYRASNQSVLVFSEASQSSQVAVAGRVDQPLPMPTPEPLELDAFKGDAESAEIRSAQSQVPVPTPDVGPNPTAPDVSVRAPAESLPLSVNESSEAPAAPKPGGVAAMETLPTQPKTFIQVNSRSAESGGEFLDGFRGESRQMSTIETAQGPRNIPSYKPSLIGGGGKPESRGKPTPERSPKVRIFPEIKLWSLPEIAKRALAPLSKSDSDTESERKTRADKASEDATPKPMQIMIRDKTFCFEKCKGPDLEKIRGMWIDRDYDFEKQKWNVWTLPRDSEAYKKVLADEPQLKEFFDHGPILIVWKNRVYKVLK
jgi:hypothetical protein